MNPVLQVRDLCFGYDAEPVLDSITFEIGEGEPVAVVGANGSGKSTLLWCVAGLLRGTGSISLFGGAPRGDALGRLGLVFQSPEDQLFMPTIAQDLALPLLNAGVPREAAQQRAAEALRDFGLEKCAGRPAARLSLGQRKRAALALALVRRPELLLLDEPTAELDGRSARELSAALRRLPVAKLIASHDIGFLREVTARALVLSEGRILAEGASGTILDDRALLGRVGLL